ncbi:MAG TPA: SDR family oxidoreductase [Pirellulales bacterium]|jgi:NAD(P)-dependent dehydrogenase (short-subunit alcohol dehydrogenase family)|nr:SDR family oxidoreductase [Pirellulales bacterium]
MRVIKNKKALVTGAASGIGKALALELAREGCHLYLWDINREGLEQTVRECAALGVEAIGDRCDVSKKKEISAAVQRLLERWGWIDILVNNAGVAYYGPTENMTAEQWDWLLSINLLAPLQLIQEFLPILLHRAEAHILNVCSISGLVASGRFAAYHVGKYGLIGMTEALRAEYARRDLGATALCPGPVQTNLYKSAASGRADKKVPSPPNWLCTTAQRVARRGVRGIKKNQAMVLVSPMAYLLYYMKRVAPWFLDSIARLSRKSKARRLAEATARENQWLAEHQARKQAA